MADKLCLHSRERNGKFFKSIAFALLRGQLCIIEEIKKLEKLNNKIYNTYMHIGAVCVCANSERNGQIGHGSELKVEVDNLVERLGDRWRY